ncbi:MAG: hypothetical protein PHI12_08515 [Dehalococcoidales bacterium]|nr:hypothetical protein [Dehalococcoidales bacterium]
MTDKKPQTTTENEPVSKCPFCDKAILLGEYKNVGAALTAHKWAAHAREMNTQLDAARQKSAETRKIKSMAKKEKKNKPLQTTIEKAIEPESNTEPPVTSIEEEPVTQKDTEAVAPPPRKTEEEKAEVERLKRLKVETERKLRAGPGIIATATAPKPGAIQFQLGALLIEVDPLSLVECYQLYKDMVTRCGLTSTFSEAMVDSFGMAWRMLAAELPAMEPRHNGNGHHEVSQEQITRVRIA